MENQTSKQQLIEDIQNLLNSYSGLSPTFINPTLLEFMDEQSLKDIIGSLLDEKEKLQDVDKQWLEQFKSEK